MGSLTKNEMDNKASINIFRMELERRLKAADNNLVIGNSVTMNGASKGKFSENLSSSMPSTASKKEKVSKLKLRDLVATFKLFQPCCFPTVSPSKFSVPPSRRSSTAATKSRAASITAATYKIITSCGRLSILKPVDMEVVDVFLPVRDEILARLLEEVGLDNWGDGAAWDVSLTVMSYKTQVVVGMNYFVKMRVNDGPTCLHCRIYKPIEGEPFLTDMICNKKPNDEIEYF